MMKRHQDAMAIVREFGKPDLFVTVTCNPEWDEIKREIDAMGQDAEGKNLFSPEDRPDITARVFKIKLNALMAEILKNGIFGKSVAHIYVIE